MICNDTRSMSFVRASSSKDHLKIMLLLTLMRRRAMTVIK
jgi:hypothetical protein